MKMKLFCLLVLAVATTACASARRSVTHVRIESDRAYVAYAEWDAGPLTFITGTKDRSRVKRCVINPDNSMSCEEDADVNAALNPQEKGARQESPAPAKEVAPPPPPAPADSEPEVEQGESQDRPPSEGDAAPPSES